MKLLSSESFPLSGNRLIEASAGTGKTHTITNLYLRLLLGQGTAPRQVSEILVLTFTNAATEELRDRIRKRIVAARHAFAAGHSDDTFLQHLLVGSQGHERDTRLLSAALQLMDEATIFTIHGFCARVLADNAFETSTLFNLNLEGNQQALLQTATEDCFRSYILTLPSPARGVALALWKSPSALQKKVRPFLFRQHLTLLPPYHAVSLKNLTEQIREVKRRWIDEDFPAAMSASGLYRSNRSVSQLPQMTEWCASDSLVTDLWKEWTSQTLGNARLRKGEAAPSHPLIAAFDNIDAALQQIPFNLWRDVMQIINANLARYKADLGQLTLDDLLIRVHEALEQPTTGEWLVKHLAARWPVAMIDEFQDTDDTQYDIFKRIYGGPGDQSLFFVGDPKQAIYQFRGADVYTYINARRAVQADDIFSLAINWRSTPQLIEAVNLLFDQPNIFGNDADIPFERVSPSPLASDLTFVDTDKDPAPITLFQIRGDDLNAHKARRMAMGYAAEETSRLLAGAANGLVLINGEPLKAGHIAFLVRNKTDARAAREALADRNIRSVYVTQESVFLSDTASDLYTILQAAIEPTNERALRTALATPLLHSTAAEIDQLSSDVTAQQRLLNEFSDYHEVWATRNVAAMIEAIMVKRELASQWLGKPEGDRQITNLRHLLELLQSRAAESPGMHRLLNWFADQRRNADVVDAEARQLRLESDRNLVKIVTMHSAKGLEYGVVMIPLASFTSPPNSQSAPHLFHQAHDNQFHAFIDFSNDPESKRLAGLEQQAEDLRLLYVAITRAKYKCYIGFHGAKAGAALARLLQLEDTSPDAVEAHLRTRLPASLFEILNVNQVNRTAWRTERDTTSLRPPGKAPNTFSDWRMHSYSGMARHITIDTETAQPDIDVTPGFSDDDPETAPASTSHFSRFSFPRGPRAGVALHTLLEKLDFTRPVEDQPDAVEHCLDRTGVTRNRAEWSAVLTEWMSDIVATPLEARLRLGDIAHSRRLDEMEFHFPLATGARMLDLLKEHHYLDTAATLTTGVLHGMMTGFMDLVFEAGGRYFLVDYKSNFLGDTAAEYALPQLQQAVRHHQYHLQYLIYCVALTRYLKSRLPHFDYEADFGGVYYLFLRGMNGSSADTGVFFDKPAAPFLTQLDNVMGGER